MGTTWHIKYVPSNETPPKKQCRQETEKTLKSFSDELSGWQEDSWLSRLNRTPAATIMNVPDYATRVFNVAFDVYTKSNGALDLTIAPALRLWGFGSGNKKTVPDENAIEAVREYIGMHRLAWNRTSRKIAKTTDHIEIDVSAVAKGLGVDVITELFKKTLKAKSALIEIGGEVRCFGTKTDGAPWMVGIESPNYGGEREILEALPLEDRALATSGDYRNYLKQNGEHYPHIFDPRSARPIRHSLCSVTVIADTCVLADSLATACLVLGENDAKKLIQSYYGVQALFILRTEDGFTVERVNLPKKDMP